TDPFPRLGVQACDPYRCPSAGAAGGRPTEIRMCILCDHGTLELLTTPLEQLAPGQLANAIRTAREAAGPGVLDHAEAVLRGEPASGAGSELYADVVVARALEAGVLKSSEAFGWGTRLGSSRGHADPRVQAFVSTCVEILDDY